jgi:hypothetical protein
MGKVTTLLHEKVLVLSGGMISPRVWGAFPHIKEASKQVGGIPLKVRHSTTPVGEKRTDRELVRQWNSIDWDEVKS